MVLVYQWPLECYTGVRHVPEIYQFDSTAGEKPFDEIDLTTRDLTYFWPCGDGILTSLQKEVTSFFCYSVVQSRNLLVQIQFPITIV